MTSHIFLALGMCRKLFRPTSLRSPTLDRVRKSAGNLRWAAATIQAGLVTRICQLWQMDKARNSVALCRAEVESQAAMDHPGMSMDPDASSISSFAKHATRYLLDTGDWTGEIAV